MMWDMKFTFSPDVVNVAASMAAPQDAKPHTEFPIAHWWQCQCPQGAHAGSFMMCSHRQHTGE
jgi:hypothetical protein